MCLAAAGAASAPTGFAQTIEVTPAQVMTDQSAVIRVAGAPPNAHVTIRAELTDGGGHAWSSEAEFVAGPQGDVDTANQAPVKGSYHAVSSMGMVWSMRPEEKGVHIYEHPHDFGSQIVLFHLILDGKQAASAQLEQIGLAQGVRQIPINGALHGAFFVPASPGKHPGILVVGGSEGGAPLRLAAWLASHGYVAFALCYFHCEGRPQDLENIPLEYFG
jgi:hypothetical protein